MGVLYKLDFTSGKSYIGITVKHAQQRYGGHAKAAEKGSKFAVHCAWRKYGPPKLSTLAVVEDSDLNETEKRAISVFGTLTPKGYNTTHGGESSPMLVPEIVAKVRGVPKSEAVKAHLSDFWTGNLDHPMKRLDVVAKVAFANKGKKRSAAWKRKHAKRLHDTSQMNTPEVIEKRAAKRRGIPFSEEHKANLRLSHIGRKESEAAKIKRLAATAKVVGQGPDGRFCRRDLLLTKEPR